PRSTARRRYGSVPKRTTELRPRPCTRTRCSRWAVRQRRRSFRSRTPRSKGSERPPQNLAEPPDTIEDLRRHHRLDRAAERHDTTCSVARGVGTEPLSLHRRRVALVSREAWRIGTRLQTPQTRRQHL